ncbi:TonB-dependent receptor [Luteimonas mephitis]|uniref:TonB-dependent receptor n=1 Tax=Luteimonas mephitis TaxID=83615 RepID=UPI003A9555A1
MTASTTTGCSRRSRLALAILAAMAFTATGAALAQDADPGRPATADATELDRVIVTANKRVENVREVAAAISVIGEQQLENMGANSLTDYADLVPGLQVQDAGAPGMTAVSIRGIAAMSSGATVATYIDEVPVGSSGVYQAANIFNLDLLPYDISRIEVLRGPQGTLYGAGAIGGLLKYVTREPDLLSREVRFGAGLSSVSDGDQGWNVRFGASLPLQEDRLGLRVSYARNELPGYTDNIVDGRKDINGGSQTGARAALAWDGDAFDLKLSALRQTIDSDNSASVALDPVTGAAMFGDLTGQVWQPQPFTKDLDLYSLTLDWDLGWADFVSATGWSDTRTMYQLDSSIQFGEFANLQLGLPEPGQSSIRYTLDLDKWTQEFRLSSKSGGRFEWQVGVFHTREDAMQRQYVRLLQGDGSALPAPLDDMFGVLAVVELPSDYKETALFANGSWRIGDRFKIDAGVRQARNDQWFSQNVPSGVLVPLGDVPGESDEDVFTWSLSPQFQVSDDVMVYARAATGYQPGGPNVALPGMPSSVDSSMLSSYEVGLKSQFADRRVQLDLAAFRIDWDDIQVAAQFNGIGGLVNGGEATSEGLELAALFRPVDRLQLGLNAAYTKGKVKNDFAASVIPQPGFDVVLNTGLAGDRMPYIPKLAWSATAEYQFDLAGGTQGQVGAALRWVGDRVNDTTERQRITAPGDPSTILDEQITPPVKLDSYRALDVYAGIGKGGWSLRAYANNVTDERAWSSVTPAASALTGATVHNAAVPIQPRTFGLEFDYRF